MVNWKVHKFLQFTTGEFKQLDHELVFTVNMRCLERSITLGIV